MLAVNHQEFSGPLPHPAMLHEYNQIVPGFAERIVTMAEKEQEQRHKMETALNEANISVAHQNLWNIKRGQWMAFSIATLGIAISAYLIFLGKIVAGTLFGGGLLLSLVGAFLKAHHQKK